MIFKFVIKAAKVHDCACSLLADEPKLPVFKKIKLEKNVL
jgi:hypothetical protein